MNYEPVIGLEVHAQLLTDTKIFCNCSTKFGSEPNAQTCPGCQGLPGTMPVLNQQTVDLAIKLGLALGSHINHCSSFERKHYFYPDLPGGYQTTQNQSPVVVGGWVEIETEDGQKKNIRLHHAHLEEDAGKLIHDQASGLSLVDLNRAGQGLLEIVSEPEIASAEEAVAYLKALREILVYLGISDGNLEEGSLRCDVNISLRHQGTKELGVRAEIKNINSFKSVTRAVEYEIRRHTAALESGQPLKRETRLFNESDGSTAPMREKEQADDYRYLPDPNLPPVLVAPQDVERVSRQMPELPKAKRRRYVEQLQLPPQDAQTLTQEPALARYFEAAIEGLTDHKAIKNTANWILTELLRELSTAGAGPDASPVTPQSLARLLALLAEGRLSGRQAKEVFSKMYQEKRGPDEIIKTDNISVVADEGALNVFVDEVLAKNQTQVQQVKDGQEKVMGFLVGQVMKVSGGKADPKKVGELIKKKIDTLPGA